MPVERAQDPRLQEPAEPALLDGVPGDARHGFVAVPELHEHDPTDARQNRAAAVAVVACGERLVQGLRDQVLDQHRGLLTYGGSGTSRRNAGAVADAEDVGEPQVLEGVDVHVHESGFIGQSAVADEAGSGHGRDGVEQVERPLFDGAVGEAEGREPGGAVDRDELVLRQAHDTVVVRDMVEHGAEARDVVHDGSRPGELDLHVIFGETLLTSPIAQEEGDLLGHATTLDGGRGGGHQEAPTRHLLDLAVHQRRGGQGADGDDRGGLVEDGFLEPRDQIPAELDARGHDQVVVAQELPVVGLDQVVLRVDPGDPRLEPRHAFGHDACFLADHLVPVGLLVHDARAQQGQSGLVQVGFRRLDDRHVELFSQP